MKQNKQLFCVLLVVFVLVLFGSNLVGTGLAAAMSFKGDDHYFREFGFM